MIIDFPKLHGPSVFLMDYLICNVLTLWFAIALLLFFDGIRSNEFISFGLGCVTFVISSSCFNFVVQR